MCISTFENATNVRVRYAWSFGSPLRNNLGLIVAASRSKGSTTPLMVLANFTPVFPPWFQELGRLIGFSSAVCLKETSRQRRFPREQRERLISFKIGVNPNNTLKTPSSGLTKYLLLQFERMFPNIYYSEYTKFLDLNLILSHRDIFYNIYPRYIYIHISNILIHHTEGQLYTRVILNNIQNILSHAKIVFPQHSLRHKAYS